MNIVARTQNETDVQNRPSAIDCKKAFALNPMDQEMNFWMSDLIKIQLFLTPSLKAGPHSSREEKIGPSRIIRFVI